MSALNFVRTDRHSDTAEAMLDEGRLTLVHDKLQDVAPLLFALAIPRGMTAGEVEAAWKAAPEGSAERTRLRGTLPFNGFDLGWLASVEDGEALLEQAARETVTTPVEVQLRDAGFRDDFARNGRRTLIRRLGKGGSSNAFHLTLSAKSIWVTFERATTCDELAMLRSSRDLGESEDLVPGFLATDEARLAVALAQVERYLASGRTGRRRRAA